MSLKVSFDTSVLIDWHKRPVSKANELDAFEGIFELKKYDSGHRWYFMYLDAVRREYGGHLLDKLSQEVEIQDILPFFDQKVSLSRGPMIVPVIIVGKDHSDAIHFFQSKAVSKADSQVLADAVYMQSNYLVTTDMRILRNSQAVEQAYSVYGIRILLPTNFLTIMSNH